MDIIFVVSPIYGRTTYLVAGRRFYVFADAAEYATNIAFGYGVADLI